LIVSNPPYLPNEGYQEKDCTIDGGITGMETTIHFIKSAVLALAQSGKILVVTSTLSYSPKIDEIIREMKLKKRTIAEKKLFFETLLVDEISFKD
jgi:methylase of polypeptide subunit release factors